MAYGCSCNIGVCVTGIAAIQRVEMAIRVIYQELYTTIKNEAIHKTKGFMRNTMERLIEEGEREERRGGGRGGEGEKGRKRFVPALSIRYMRIDKRPKYNILCSSKLIYLVILK